MRLSQRLRYSLSSLFLAGMFFFSLFLSYEYRYVFLFVQFLFTPLVYGWSLGLRRKKKGELGLWFFFILPLAFSLGFSLFSFLLTWRWWSGFLLSSFFLAVNYVIFLVENVFWYSLENKTVPLYRAAYTVSWITTLFSSFLLFDSLLSFKFSFWLNAFFAFFISLFLFLYHYWTVDVEVREAEFGRKASLSVLVPAVLMAQMATVLSFWPLSLFLGSFYLTAIFYVLSALVRMQMKERLFKKVRREFLWLGLVIFASVFWAAKWRG